MNHANQAPTDSPASTADSSPITPGSFELYVIIAGIMLGILLGPAVLGRLSPSLYDTYIACRAQPKHSLAEFEEQTLRLQDEIKASQSSPAAMDEFLARRNLQRKQLMAEDQLESIRSQLTGLSRCVALMLALMAAMVIETILDPSARLARLRLQAARYILMGFWVAFTLAQPVFLAGFPLTFFTGMILLIALSVLLSAWNEKHPKTS